jgi:hypothetical protein
MDASDHEGLLRLIENEISIGLTFLDTHMLSSGMGHTTHAEQALENAKVSYKTSANFLKRLAEAEASAFQRRLEQLDAAISSADQKH